ncbi:amidase [Belnapia sp. T6]|uniref:Amidase n=1 Tax=Belnapia mucosa TaxID=2804532 RepID=A0ABS1UZ56_9PROT|nr:amidase family protein [Belnapia mucosa]MBL6454741.1 amidase [Belnapia mucosa]
MTEALCRLPATVLRVLIAQKQVSPVELTRAVLRRAMELQPVLNCFITLAPEPALAAAAEAERAVMAGEELGLLHGIPCSVKDIVNTAGMRTTFGSRLLAENVPAEDAAAVARLRGHRAIIFGKTTTPEFGTKCVTDAPLFGRTRNAWSAGATSGGSSGGAAVAVASGIGPIAVATDGGGSTRIPAACNGVVGLKQSLGAIPHSQVPDAFGNYTYVTPTTRTVGDTALMLQAMGGPHDSDPWSIGVPVPDYLDAARPEGDLSGKRVLFCAAPPGRPLAVEVERAFRTVLGHLESLGAKLEEFDGAELEVEPIWRAINHTTWRARFAPMAERDGDRMCPSLLKQLAAVREVSGVEYQQAMFDRAALFRRVQALFGRADFLVTPTLMRSALPIEADPFARNPQGEIEIDGVTHEGVRSNWFPWTMPFNLTGHPAISLPAGFDEAGLPLAVQLVAPLRADAPLLRAAALLEAQLDLLGRWPDP